MSVGQELAHAIKSHPSRVSSGHVLLAMGDADFEAGLDASLEYALGDAFCVGACKAHGFAPDKVYDAIVMSNVLTTLQVTDKRQEIAHLLTAALDSLRNDGILVLRENLEGYSAHLLSDLTKFFDVFAVHRDGRTLGLSFYGMNQVQDSIHARSNFLDVYWVLTRTSETHLYDEKLATFRDFLDQTQYTEDNVKSYEWIFGNDFISPGGADENRRVLRKFRNLHPGQRMLDIGVGIGGGAKQAAREFGIFVLGADLSSNMIMHAFERNQRDKDHRVEYQIADAMVYKHAPNKFDLIFSRDCIQHIKDTEMLFKNIFTWLKPGGQMLITMYGKGLGSLQPKFLEYVRQRHYGLKSLDEFKAVARKTGFVNIYTENMTPRFKEILLEERQKATAHKQEFLELFDEKLFEQLMEGWSNKLQFIDDDNHNWLLLRAEKPVHALAWAMEIGA
ncbi:CBN-PMT-2 protein [Aphelenchoides avenae]|nr:CBN-PMT-2 protein [Aphelenchus avenae]